MARRKVNKEIASSAVEIGDHIRVTETKEIFVAHKHGPDKLTSGEWAIIVGDGEDTIALTGDKVITLLDKEDDRVTIPDTALFVYWNDGGADYYARFVNDRGEWLTDEGDVYSTEGLTEMISAVGGNSSFQVLKHKSANNLAKGASEVAALRANPEYPTSW